jgi:putative oxidoreductase
MGTVLVVVARLVFAGLFAMAFVFKLADMPGTAAYIAAAGFPIPMVLAVLATILEVALTLAFLTGAFFSEAALVAAAYVVFLGFAFHGPATWEANPMEFGFFVDHFTFMAGLFFAAVHGPGRVLAWRVGVLGRRLRDDHAG